MRKFIAGISLTILSVTTLSAYTQEDRIRDMQIMAAAMQSIQTGFFYNNIDMIKGGGATLIETIMRVEPPLSELEEKDIITHMMNNKVQITNNIKKRIRDKTRDMIKRFEEGDPNQALRNFTKIEKACMKCHVQIRHW
jgi:hypothetical protein